MLEKSEPGVEAAKRALNLYLTPAGDVNTSFRVIGLWN